MHRPLTMDLNNQSPQDILCVNDISVFSTTIVHLQTVGLNSKLNLWKSQMLLLVLFKLTFFMETKV